MSTKPTLPLTTEDPVLLWAEIHRLRAAVIGPEGYETWQEAAIVERTRRVRAEAALAASPPQEAQPAEQKVEPDNTCVICPQCCNQFRAIPVQVQHLLLDAGYDPPFMISARQNAWQEAQPVPELSGVLADLVHALDNAFISSWQSTAAWQKELDRARIVVAHMGERK